MAVAHVIAPGLVRTEHLHVEVDTGPGPCRGRTVVDRRGRTGNPANAHVAVDVDANGFLELMCERIAALG
jgi:inosine-uridine nucleoside N-ribohydrolase